MEALYAIALLCHVVSGSPFVALADVDKYQLKCQQEYISCYEKKMALEVPPSQDPKVWVGKLKSCVVERVVR